MRLGVLGRIGVVRYIGVYRCVCLGVQAQGTCGGIGVYSNVLARVGGTGVYWDV